VIAMVSTALGPIGRCAATVTLADGSVFRGAADAIRESSGHQCRSYTGQLLDIPRIRFQPPEIVVTFSNMDAGRTRDRDAR
jgi:hypothetical protein